jgi:AraC-like DNA-binding protein
MIGVRASSHFDAEPETGAVGPGARFLRVRGNAKLYRGVKAHHAILLTLEGRSSYWVDGATATNGPGDLQLNEPGQVHRVLSRDAPASLQLLALDAGLVDAARDALGVRASARLRSSALPRGDERAKPLMAIHRLALAKASDGFAAETTIAAAAAAFVGYMGEGEARAPRLRVQVRRARDFLLANLAEPITLDALAEHARADKFHLCRAFTREVGLAPHRFLTHARVARACFHLARGARPSSLAPLLGFSDQSQMHRHFVRIVGVTPGAYAR